MATYPWWRLCNRTADGGDTLVTNGSPSGTFSQNKQNEPAVAIDAHAPSVVAAGANEEIDDEGCAAGDPTTCPFTPGVGTSGVYFSGNGGASFTQPTYSGWTARDCLGPDGCTRTQGPAVLNDRQPAPGPPRRKGNELIRRLRAGRCELCEQRANTPVHHVRKLADLAKPGRPQPEWTELMARMRRKTLVVCAPCHDTIHTRQPTAAPTQ